MSRVAPAPDDRPSAAREMARVHLKLRELDRTVELATEAEGFATLVAE